MQITARNIVIPTVLTTALVAGAWTYIRFRPLPEPPSYVPVPSARHYQLKKEFGPGFRCFASSTLVTDANNIWLEAEFYRLILESAPYVTGPAPILVESVSIPIRGFAAGGGTMTGSEPWPSAIVALARRGAMDCVTFTPDAFPARAQLVPLDRLSPPDYQGKDQFFGFSRALLDDRRMNALVYYERHCRGCGVGEFVWFTRESQAAAWKIGGRRWSWIN